MLAELSYGRGSEGQDREVVLTGGETILGDGWGEKSVTGEEMARTLG